MNQSSAAPQNLKLILEEHGGFHDAVIEAFQLLPEDRIANFSIDDLHSNYRGLPGYEGEPVAAQLMIKFHEIVLNVDFYDPRLKIYDCEVDTKESGEILIIKFSPSGRVRFKVEAFELTRR